MSSRPLYFSPHTVDAIARGRMIDAIKHLREDNALGLRDAKAAVEAYVAGRRDFVTATAPAATVTDGEQDLAAKVDRLLQDGHAIAAIKLVREATGMGLKEARDWVEARRTGQDPSLPAAPAAKAADPRAGATVQRDAGGGWLAWAGLGMLLLGSAVWWLGR